MRYFGPRPRAEIGAGGIGMTAQPTVTLFHVPDKNGVPMRTGLELLTLIAPVFFSKHHPYLIRISPAQHEVTQ